MRQIILYTLITFFVLQVVSISRTSAQNSYQVIENIFYPQTLNPSEYEKERCYLDIYYPTEKEDFTTVVWFHGGGITGGNKYIPERLMKQGIAIVAVNYRLHPRAKKSGIY